MATNITTTYAGAPAEGYVAAATLAGMTLGGMDGNSPNITVHETVPGKLVVRNADVSGNFLRNGTCDFTDSGDIDYSETLLDLKEIQVNIQDCKDNWIKTWESETRRSLRLDQGPPMPLAEWIMMRIASQVSGATERNVWQGASANQGEIAGLIGRISAAKSATPDVTGASYTKATIIDRLEQVLNAINDAVYSSWIQDNGLRIYIPLKADKAYQLALGVNAGGSYQDAVTVGRKPMDFNGIPLVVAPGLPANTIIAARESDLHYGCNLLADNNEVRLLDMAENDGSRNFRYILRYAADTNITNASDITWCQFGT